jgi:predicted  nucleic acid-binding Zn-ribbon protein
MLDRLSDVQTRDLELDNLQEEKGRTPPELTETRERRQGLQERLKKRHQEREEFRKRLAQNELELKSLDERRKAAAAAGMRAESSKEASQYQNQELQFATRVQELEEDTLPLMGELERLDGDIDELQSELDELEPVLTGLDETERARIEKLDTRIESLAGERASLAKDIDRPLLRQYEQVRKARRGVGLVPVVSNQQCGGCNVKLPIHVVQKARKGVGVTRCPSCGRILWAKE